MTRFRDAVTGWFVSRKTAEANPSTTVREMTRQREEDAVVLRFALNRAEHMAHPYQQAKVLEDAIRDVLSR